MSSECALNYNFPYLVRRSEHERHALQCPYIRGESTDNVPLTLTEASHPAVQVITEMEGKAEVEGSDEVVCLGTSLGTDLLAVGTERGRVIILDMSHGMLILVWVYVCI